MSCATHTFKYWKIKNRFLFFVFFIFYFPFFVFVAVISTLSSVYLFRFSSFFSYSSLFCIYFGHNLLSLFIERTILFARSRLNCVFIFSFFNSDLGCINSEQSVVSSQPEIHFLHCISCYSAHIHWTMLSLTTRKKIK